VAGGLFILPGVVAIMALSLIYAAFGNVPEITALFFGLKAAVLAIVLQAVVRIGSRALKNRSMVAIAVAAFLAIFILRAPFPAIVFGAGLLGYLGGRTGHPAFAGGGPHGPSGQGAGLADSDSALGEMLPPHARPNAAWSMRIGAIFLLLWLLPTVGLLLAAGPANAFAQIAVFFSKMAVVTFGGAYAVLAYVAQAAVDRFGWLRPGEMLDGLGLAETTPGPLIMVTQFVGFMGAFRNPGSLHPYLAGALGGLLTTWVTFAPCFLWIFLGGPYVEMLRGNRPLSAALAAITAAVVGVILNLALWFALHTLFGELRAIPFGFGALEIPVLASVNWPAAVLTLAAIGAVFWLKTGLLPLLGGCATAGLLYFLATRALA
jgi:chromate transporter